MSIKVFSTGLPAIPLRGAANVFEEKYGVKFEIVAGPVEQWLSNVLAGDGDVVCVGAEYMMDDLQEEHGLIMPDTRTTVGYRRSVIIVRKGNPKGIRGVEDLAERDDIKILICRGACQRGLWDDVASKAMLTDRIRKKIVEYGTGCLDTYQRWRRSVGRIDAAIAWNVYGNVWPNDCDVVELPKDLQVYRSTNVAVLKSTRDEKLTRAFIDFLKTEESKNIYEKFGWIIPKH
ncbi:substrate-binding domain-containing protein [Candidatus Bathyarchaeota archaeon]|nr:substrate-binding domain-containing protein [Candidatus Bathyarchaeota archaeon]